MNQIFSYLFFRHKSLLYYKFPKAKLSLPFIYYVYFSLIIFSVVGSYMMFDQLYNKFLDNNSAFYITIFFSVSLCVSGLNKAIINSSSKLNKKNDIKILLTKPISPKSVLFMKFFETIFFTEIFLVFNIFVGVLSYFLYTTNNLFISLLFTVNLIFFIYAIKISIFLLSFTQRKLFTNIIVLCLSILKFISLIISLAYLINMNNPIISEISIVVYVYKNIMNLPLDYIAHTAVNNAGIFSIILLIINMLLIYYINKVERKTFQYEKLTTNTRHKIKAVTFSSTKRVELNLIKLLKVYIQRQKKQEIMMTYLPLVSSIICIVGVCVLLYIRIPNVINEHILIFYLFLSGMIVKTVTDTYCFLSCIDIHGEKFFLFKLAGVSNKKVIFSQVMFNSFLNFTVTTIVLFCFTIFIKVPILNIVFILFLCGIQVALFNLIYCIASISHPNFRVELITSLPSAKAKILANILIFISLSIEVFIFYVSSNHTIFFCSTILLNVFYFIILYRLANLKMRYLRLNKHGNQLKRD
ncbi:hypothetical protein COM69_18250 [Bacillus toyonensis]|nr:hypothetical protein COM69_18250 [Bacillus toyonensis]PHD47153.1 hypothetical protein COF65_00170 [Bacillus toyonensis]